VAGSRQTTRNYEIDRTLAYTRQPAGRMKRLSVAVLIDNVRVVGKDGKITETPLTPDQINRVTALVKDAVGFDTERGDSVNVVNSAWRGDPVPDAEALETVPIWERPWARDFAKILAGLILALAMIFGVIKPMMRQVMAGGRGAGPGGPAGPGQIGVDPGAMGQGAALAMPSNTLAYEQQVAQARSMVAQDPARVAQVVKTWVSNDG
jgi:flagellar M-ring protein FliF